MINIGIYGKVNVGKSSLLNALTGQDIAIVSSVEGTTTDVVKRRFELPNIGPVTFFDTAGFEDRSELGEARISKTLETLEIVDLAIVIEDGSENENFMDLFWGIPSILLHKGSIPSVEEIFRLIREAISPEMMVEPKFYGNLLSAGEIVVLVCPIDNGAPVGRLILPQVQAIRAALDINAMAIVVQPSELKNALQKLNPTLVVTDSQVFDVVSQIVADFDENLKLTSFSILLASLKGDKASYDKGLTAVNNLKIGDRVLVIEHCSHHASCDDIGRVKIPKLLNSFVGGELKYTFINGVNGMPKDLSQFDFAVQCGGCMTVRRQIINRIVKLNQANVPVTNYGLLLKRLLTSCK